MYKNYLTTAFRNLYKNKLYSLINVGGLAIGLAACIFILLFVRFEASYDTWLPDSERIYRLHNTFNIPGRSPFRTVRSSGPMRQAFLDNFEGIESATRISVQGPRVFQDGTVYDQQVEFVDPSFFDVFDLPLLAGDRATALSDNQSLILSETTAARFFGEQDPIGETLTLCCFGADSSAIDFKITGLMADTPDNAHFEFNAVGLIEESRYTDMPFMFESWTSVNNFTYYKLREGVDPAVITDRFDWFLDNIVPGGDDVQEQFGMKMSELANFYFMPIADIHLNAREQAGDGGDMRPLGDKTLVIGFLLIAFLVLGIATINFINLATARFINRAQEVSMRKVLGAGRRQVVQQFLGEALLASFLGLGVALVVVQLGLPWFNEFLGTNLSLILFGAGSMLPELVLLAALTGFIGGAYPAFFVSRMAPAQVLQSGSSGDAQGSGWLKSGLVVFQFAISIALITATAVTFSQTDYAKSLNLGFESDNMIILRNLGRSGATEQKEALLVAIRQMPGVVEAALSSDVPTDNNENNTGFSIQGREQESGEQILNYIAADYGFFEMYGIEPVAGRIFSPAFGSDKMMRVDPDNDPAIGSAVITESAARRLGFDNPEEAIGEVMVTGLFRNNAFMTVIGIIPDISFRSARFDALPTVYFSHDNSFDDITIKYSGDNPQPVIDQVEALWTAQVATVPFAYRLLDEMIAAQYAGEDRQALTFSGFSLLAVLVSCLGLFALASLSTERRTKEIGVRKVFGASVRQIVQLLTWQFSRPVVWANIIAWPVAWYFLNEWLSGFVYRIDLGVSYFLFAGLAALIIAWGTVAGHAWRVARSNPIHSLRYE